MSTTDLRPLSLGELLDATFTVYRRHIRLLISIALIPSVTVIPGTIASKLLMPDPAAADAAPGDPLAFTLVLVMMIGVTSVVYFLTYALAFGATTLAVSEIYLGRPVTWTEAIGRAWGKFGRLLGLFMLIGLRMAGIALGIALLITAVAYSTFRQPAFLLLGLSFGILIGSVASAVVALRYGLAIPAVIVEDIRPGEAIQRSVDLSRGHLGRVFLIGLLTVILGYVAIIVFQGPFIALAAAMPTGSAGAMWLTTLSALTGAIGSALSMPLMQIALVLLYYDVRIRKEGFDLQLLLADLERPVSIPGAATVP